MVLHFTRYIQLGRGSEAAIPMERKWPLCSHKTVHEHIGGREVLGYLISITIPATIGRSSRLTPVRAAGMEPPMKAVISLAGWRRHRRRYGFVGVGACVLLVYSRQCVPLVERK